MNYYLFEDELYGFTAIASSRTGAWQMIRGKCHQENLKVPTMDKIRQVKKMPDDFIKMIKANK